MSTTINKKTRTSISHFEQIFQALEICTLSKFKHLLVKTVKKI